MQYSKEKQEGKREGKNSKQSGDVERTIIGRALYFHACEPAKNFRNIFEIIAACYLFSARNENGVLSFLQGRPGEKGQKGELGSPGFDVFSAVKVSS